MHYIDKLLNELEMLNLADQRTMPPVLSVAVNKVIEESPEVTVLAQAKPGTVIRAECHPTDQGLVADRIEKVGTP